MLILLIFRNAPEFLDADDLALGMKDHPCIWTDGSREEYPLVVLRSLVLVYAFLPLRRPFGTLFGLLADRVLEQRLGCFSC